MPELECEEVVYIEERGTVISFYHIYNDVVVTKH